MTDLERLNARLIADLNTRPRTELTEITLDIAALQASALVEIAQELHYLNAVALLAIADHLRDLIHELETARKA